VPRFLFISLCLLLPAQQAGLGRAQSNEVRSPKANAAVQVCRDKISSVLGPSPLISPEGIHVAVPEKDVEAALARGFQWDFEALLKEAQTHANGDKQSPEQAILAKLSDEELTALYSDIFLCTSKHRDVLSRDDLVEYGVAMGEIADAREYRNMGHLLVKNDEERVEKYNALVVKYNELLARCSH
jgi:hypothetical protein